MSRTVFLGIDGGGTRCRARLVDDEGRILGEGLSGSANLTLGVDRAVEAIRAAAGEAFRAAGLQPADVSVGAGFGLAGANVPSLARDIRAASFPFADIVVASDAVAACLGAHGGRDGAILILGTGSQGLAIVGGRATTVGGWGFLLSDDGSGAVLGHAAVRAAVASVDGLAAPSDLTREIMAGFGGDPAAAVLWAGTATPKDFGAYAPRVFHHYDAGDRTAVRLLGTAVAEVTGMIEGLLAAGARRVALMGGLAEPYRPLLPDFLHAALVRPEGDALDGAIAMARRGSGYLDAAR